MQTKYLGPIDSSQLTAAAPLLEWASHRLQQGGLIAFPTETLYGLGCSIFCDRAVSNIYRVKNRQLTHPLPIQLAYFDQMQFVARAVSPLFRVLFQAFLPGPLTLVVKRHTRIPSAVVADCDSVAVRFPSHPIAKRLIELTGCPLAVPSANITGKPGATSAFHVLEDFRGVIDGVIDGGPTQHGIESTILSLENPKEPKILRVGAISKQKIEQVIGKTIAVDKQAYCGLKSSRFPKLRPMVRLFSSWEEIDIYLRLSKKRKTLIMAMAISHDCESDCFELSSSNLYDGLRFAEQKGYVEILVLCDHMVSKEGDLLYHLKQIARA